MVCEDVRRRFAAVVRATAARELEPAFETELSEAVRVRVHFGERVAVWSGLLLDQDFCDSFECLGRLKTVLGHYLL